MSVHYDDGFNAGLLGESASPPDDIYSTDEFGKRHYSSVCAQEYRAGYAAGVRAKEAAHAQDILDNMIGGESNPLYAEWRSYRDYCKA